MSRNYKPVVDYGADVSDFNNNPGSLLLLAWSRQAFALSHATDAQIINIDDGGFDVIILFRTKTEVLQIAKRYDFGFDERKIIQNIGVKGLIQNIITSSSYASLPPGFSKYIIGLIWIIPLCIVFELDVVPLLERHHHHLAQHIPTILVTLKPYAVYLLGFLLVSHSLEAIYVLFLLSSIVSSPLALLSWVAMVVVFGMPCTTRAMAVHTANQKLKQ